MSSEFEDGNEAASTRWAVKIGRGLSPAEERQLALWLGDDSRRHGALLRAEAAWCALAQSTTLEEIEEDDEPAFQPRAQGPVRRSVLVAGGGLIAATMIALLGVWTFHDPSDTYTTTTGEIRRLPLADGSLTTMNGTTDIRVRYSATERDIQLNRGEAWFRVAKDKSRPFVVASGAMRVEAVGTEFDVRRYPTFAEVVVNEGTVRISATVGAARSIAVGAGFRARVDDRGRVETTAVSAFDMERQLAWREGYIVLDEMTLATAAAEFSRYSSVRIVVDPALANSRLVGRFQLDDVDGFVDASAQLVGGRIERKGQAIRIVKASATP